MNLPFLLPGGSYMRILCTLILFLFLSCLIPDEQVAGSLVIMTWNVQNLFDAETSGLEYEEYDPLQSDWNEESMRAKMESLQEIILSIEPDLPDIILLQEVENREVLEILNRDYLDGHYQFVEAWGDGKSAISCGLLSLRTPDQVHLHYPGEFGKSGLRPLVEIHFSGDGSHFILFNNHWKSRSGGQAATEQARIMSASVLASRIAELRKDGEVNIIVAGDLNGSCEDFRPGGSQTAQIPVEELHNVPWQNSLFISYEEQDTFIDSGKVILFSPWKSLDSEGSYFFQNRWMKLDQLLLDRGLFDGKGLEYEGSQCVANPLMCDDQGLPMGWESWRQEGYSDHFPLILFLENSEK